MSDFFELVAELEPEIFNFWKNLIRNQISYSIFMYGTRTQDFWEKKQLEPGADQLLTSGSNPGYPELSWNRVWFLESEQNQNWILLIYFLKNQTKNWIPDSITPRIQREEKAPAQIQNPRPCSKPLTHANPKPKAMF